MLVDFGLRELPEVVVLREAAAFGTAFLRGAAFFFGF